MEYVVFPHCGIWESTVDKKAFLRGMGDICHAPGRCAQKTPPPQFMRDLEIDFFVYKILVVEWTRHVAGNTSIFGSNLIN
jgi:hypothetical protein